MRNIRHLLGAYSAPHWPPGADALKWLKQHLPEQLGRLAQFYQARSMSATLALSLPHLEQFGQTPDQLDGLGPNVLGFD